MQPATERAAAFGDLTPLIAPRQVAVVGASDRVGNLGGLSVSFLDRHWYSSSSIPLAYERFGSDTLAVVPLVLGSSTIYTRSVHVAKQVLSGKPQYWKAPESTIILL